MSKATPYLLIGGGITVGVAAWLGVRKSNETTDTIKDAIDLPPVALPPSPSVVASLPKVNLRLTGYWPFTARSDEKKMEGGVFDRMMPPGKYKNDPTSQQYKDHILHTVEDYLAGTAPFVSLSGDDAIWPYAQAVRIPWTNGGTILGRVVDTGSHFRGINKLYRAVGFEPIDVCVASSSTVVPTKVEAQIVPGDNFATKGLMDVAMSKFKDQTVAGMVREGRSAADHEALARAVESELGGRQREEQIAAAWVMRNRADEFGLSLSDLLAPSGEYGSPQKSGGYASTRKVSTERSRSVAGEVLDAFGVDDPTGGAIDFWMPSEQDKMRKLGDVYRAAKKSGDLDKARRYQKYADYGSEGDVRVRHARGGMRPTQVVGVVELLGKVRG